MATLQPGASPSPSRFLDALIGGAVALLVGLVLFPRDPVRAMAKAAAPVVSDLAVALRMTAEALRDGDESRARRALEMARATDPDLAGFFDAVALARETSRCATRAAYARARPALRAGRPADGLRRTQHPRPRAPRAERDPPARRRP